MDIKNSQAMLEHNIRLNNLIINEWKKVEKKYQDNAIRCMSEEYDQKFRQIDERKKNMDEQRFSSQGDEEKETAQPDDKKSMETEIEELLFPKIKVCFEKIKEGSFDFQEDLCKLYKDFMKYYDCQIKEQFKNENNLTEKRQKGQLRRRKTNQQEKGSKKKKICKKDKKQIPQPEEEGED